MKQLCKIRPYLGTVSFYKKVWDISFPIALQSLIQIGVNMMDTVMLGTLQETVISASSLANQFISIYHICCMGIGMGASVMVSRFWGSRDLTSLKKSVTIMLRICLMIAGVFIAATAFFPTAIMRLYTPDQAVIAAGTRYLKWSVWTYLFLGISLDCIIVLRSTGQSRIPLLCSIAGFGANLLLNYMFIFGRFGAPRMEIEGAALATLLARMLECGLIVTYFFVLDHKICYRIRDLLADCSELTGEYLNICIPVVISDTLMALGNSAVAIIMGHIGPSFVSANAITFVTQQLTMVFTQGIAQASCIITGHTLGEGKPQAAQRQGYTFILVGAALGAVAALLICLIRDPVISLYNISPETKEIAEQLMGSIAFIMVFQSTNSILTKGVLRGGGDTRFLMFGDILFLWAASVPLGAMAGLVWHLSAWWVYFFMKIDQVIKCIWCVARLRSGKWIRQIRSRQDHRDTQELQID